MIQVAVYVTTKEGAKWVDACHLLEMVESSEFRIYLQGVNWEGDGKKRFLMGMEKIAFCGDCNSAKRGRCRTGDSRI